MPRRPRLAAGDLAYHVLNRRVGRLPLFDKPADYAAFEKVLAEAHAQTRIRIAAYCLMPNHWHLLLWPRHDGELSEVLRWITVTHTQRWHAHHHTAGTGPVYQGRFKSFPVHEGTLGSGLTIDLLWSKAGVKRGSVTATLISPAHEKERWGHCSVESAIHVRTHGMTANTLAGAPGSPVESNVDSAACAIACPPKGLG